MSLTNLIANLEEEKALENAKNKLKNGVEPIKIIEESQKGMKIVGDKFRDNQYFISELLIAAELLENIMKEVKPHIKTQEKNKIGKIVLGTVKGDLHDIGKNIFKILATANGFDVIDLGKDVPIDEFIKAVKENKPDIVGMSGLITTIFDSMENVIKKLESENLRDDIKIVIGGAPVNEDICKKVGADAFTRNASEGVDICKSFINN